MARQLTDLILDAQGTGEMKMAKYDLPSAAGPSQTNAAAAPHQPLTADLVRFLSNCGVMKFVVDAGTKSGSLLR